MSHYLSMLYIKCTVLFHSIEVINGERYTDTYLFRIVPPNRVYRRYTNILVLFKVENN